MGVIVVQVAAKGTDPVCRARLELASVGACVMSSAEVNGCLGVDDGVWTEFGRHWEDLAPDRYAAELGTQRLRRYGHFAYTTSDGTVRQLPHAAFAQPEDSNPLYVDRERHFQPLTSDFVADPLLHRLLELLAELATALDEPAEWNVKVTPFRVLASAGDKGEATPEGMHRDGVTFVTSLLVGRGNAIGGESSVLDTYGKQLLTTTLTQPGTLLLGDDRRTLHGVSPIRPVASVEPARRDVLVITFAPNPADARSEETVDTWVHRKPR